MDELLKEQQKIFFLFSHWIFQSSKENYQISYEGKKNLAPQKFTKIATTILRQVSSQFDGSIDGILNSSHKVSDKMAFQLK